MGEWGPESVLPAAPPARTPRSPRGAATSGLGPLPSRSKSLRKEESFRLRNELVLVTRLLPFLAGAMALWWRLRGAEHKGSEAETGKWGAAKARERAEGRPTGLVEGGELRGLGVKKSRGTYLRVPK